jgi:hypothetical protein
MVEVIDRLRRVVGETEGTVTLEGWQKRLPESLTEYLEMKDRRSSHVNRAGWEISQASVRDNFGSQSLNSIT